MTTITSDQKALLKAKVHEASGLASSLWSIDQASKLANTQEKAYLDEVKTGVGNLKGATETQIDSALDQYSKAGLPADQILSNVGAAAVEFERSGLNTLSTTYPYVQQILSGIESRLSQSSLGGGGMAAPVRRSRSYAPRRKRRRTTAPRRRSAPAPRRRSAPRGGALDILRRRIGL